MDDPIDFNTWINSDDPDKAKDLPVHKIDFYPHEVTALVICVADQLNIFRGVLMEGDVSDKHREQAQVMNQVHRDLIEKLDVDNEGLLDAWDESVRLVAEQFAIDEQENNIVELDAIRKEKEQNELNE